MTKPHNDKPDNYEETLIAQKAEAEALFTSIGDGAISTDAFGRITRVNPVAQEMLGYSEKELLDEWYPKKVISLNVDGSPTNLIDRPITRAFLTGSSISDKLYYRTKDGTALPLAITVSPIMLNNNPIGAIEVFRDITLELEVDRMKSEFISLASHQLRTPLSAVKTYSHMLLDGYMGDLTEAQKQSLHTIISASNRMNELISTLLNITRMESGTIAITPKNLKIDVVCQETLKDLELFAEDKGIDLKFKNGSGDKTINTDRLILKEIITNLASNAIKYTPEGGKVTVMCKERANDVLISVSDTGWGIPAEVQDKIFSKFFRAQNVLKRETSGTGLGLYLVNGLVQAIGGKIWFRSTENEGTTFYFTVPKITNFTSTSDES